MNKEEADGYCRAELTQCRGKFGGQTHHWSICALSTRESTAALRDRGVNLKLATVASAELFDVWSDDRMSNW